MRRRTSSFFALLFLLTAALPGAAVLARPAAAADCPGYDPQQLEAVLPTFPVVVIATVESAPPGGPARLRPEAYLKGPAQGEAIDLRPPAVSASRCAAATFAPGERVLLFLGEAGAWPSEAETYILAGGSARSQARPAIALAEADFLGRVRALTGQYAVPAASASEGAGIDWWTTVVPVGFATLALFAVGLYLMRIWHRIDPS